MVKAGEEAVLVSPKDPEAMAQAVVALWESPQRRASLREAGLRKAGAYGWATVREQWRGVYERAKSAGN